MIYLDYAASTPLCDDALKSIQFCLDFKSNSNSNSFANPSSLHKMGYLSKHLIESESEFIADYLGVSNNELIWTSGATESNNLAILGLAQANNHKGKTILTVKKEHKSVLDPCDYLEKNGFNIIYLDVNKEGLIDLDSLENSLKNQMNLNNPVSLLSCMWVNNETGVIQPIEKIAQIAEKYNTLFHVDAVQAVGKINLKPQFLKNIAIHALSLSGHKIYGPKGIGLLYLQKKPKKVRIQPQILGGGQQNNLRSGTLPTHQIIGFCKAFKWVISNQKKLIDHAENLKKYFIENLNPDLIELNISIDNDNSKKSNTVPHILNIYLKKIDGEVIQNQLMQEVMISQGSACNSYAVLPSHVLSAMKINSNRIFQSCRVSIGYQTQQKDLDQFFEVITKLSV